MVVFGFTCAVSHRKLKMLFPIYRCYLQHGGDMTVFMNMPLMEDT